MCFNQRGNISTLNGSSLKLVDKFTYLGSSVSSTERDNMWLAKAWTAIDRLSVIWKSDLTDKIRDFPTSGHVNTTTWMLTKWMEKKLNSNYIRIAVSNIEQVLEAVAQKAVAVWPPITKTIQIRQTRHAGHSWRNKDELINDILPWTPSHGWAKAGRPARTYKQLLCQYRV